MNQEKLEKAKEVRDAAEKAFQEALEVYIESRSKYEQAMGGG